MEIETETGPGRSELGEKLACSEGELFAEGHTALPITDPMPAVIAIAVAAELLQVRSQAAERANTGAHSAKVLE
mgnify:CR=1 FL=1